MALDSSTTAYYLALELRAKRELVVVTNGLLIAAALADAPGITVLVTGGILRLSAMSLVGDFGADVLRTTRINKGFLGARGLSLERGLLDLNPEEARIKQAMADACEQVYGILDGTKWQRSALLSFVRTTSTTGSSPTRALPPRRSRPGAGGDRRDRRRAGAAAEAASRRPGTCAGRRAIRGAAADDDDGGSRPRRPERAGGGRQVRRRAPRGDEVHRFPNEPVRVRGMLYWDILGIYRGVLEGLRAAARSPGGSTRSARTRGGSTSA